MENTRKLIQSIIDASYESIASKDEFQKLEQEKNEIIPKLEMRLSDEDYEELEKLIDCFQEQSFLFAMGFSYIRVLDLVTLLKGIADPETGKAEEIKV